MPSIGLSSSARQSAAQTLNPANQSELFTIYRHHAVFTDSPLPMLEAEKAHRSHAIIEHQDLFAIEYVSPRDGTTAVYLRPTASHGGCASSWAHDDGMLSGSALAAQCKRIEQRLVEVFGLPEAYPHSFYGKFPAKNRADCIDVMRGLSTGRLDSGLLTPFPF